MNRLLLVGLVGFACLAGTAPTASAQLGIRPASIQVDLDNKRPTGTFTITNDTDVEQRVRVIAMDFSFSNEGALQGTNETPYSLVSMIKFNPKEFDLPPRASRAVRFSVVKKADLEDGEYWAALSFQPLSANTIVEEGQEGRSMKLNLITTTLVPIYGQLGEIIHGADLEDAQARVTDAGIEVQATLRNTGTGYLLAEANYEVVDPSGTTVAEGPMGREYVLRDTRQTFRNTLKDLTAPEGTKVRISFRFKQLEEILSREAELIPNGSSGE